MKKLWWMSWNQQGSDSRPMIYSPPAGVVGWWESGFGEGYATVVALVYAETEAAAKFVVTAGWEPGVGEWRFVREYDASKPPGDRFPAPVPGEWNYDRWPWGKP